MLILLERVGTARKQKVGKREGGVSEDFEAKYLLIDIPT